MDKDLSDKLDKKFDDFNKCLEKKLDDQKLLITNESASRRRAFDHFKEHHDEVAAPYIKQVAINTKILVGNGNPEDGLVTQHAKTKTKMGLIVWFGRVLMVAIVGGFFYLLRVVAMFNAGGN